MGHVSMVAMRLSIYLFAYEILLLSIATGPVMLDEFVEWLRHLRGEMVS